MNPPAIHDALRQLQDSPDALPWNERRDLVTQIADAIMSARKSPPKPALDLLRLLCDDPKMEVRKAIADQLHLLPDDEFVRLVARLAEDRNAFVRSAAERALERRKRSATVTSRRSRGLDKAENDLAALERKVGVKTAKQVRAIAQQLYEGVVGASVHELRSVVTGMKGSVEQLLRDIEAGNGIAAARRIGPKLKQQFNFMERLFEDMKAFTQAMPHERRSERIADVVMEALGMVRSHFAAIPCDVSMIELHVEAPEHLAAAMSRVQIVLALRNLIKNAFESHMTEPGQFEPGSVRVVAREFDAGTIEIVVADTGMGMTKTELSGVVQMIPGRTSKGRYGTGYGLPIAHRNVTSHGGSLRLESAVGKGTTATVLLSIEPRHSP